MPGKAKRRLVMRGEAAKALHVAPARISQWVSDGAPVARRGRRGKPARYDIEALRRWRVARERLLDEDGLSLEAERAKLARAQRIRIEREGRVRAGDLVERLQVIFEGHAVMGAVKARLLALPPQAVQRGIVPPDQQRAFRELVMDVLREFSSWRTIHDLPRTAGQEAAS